MLRHIIPRNRYEVLLSAVVLAIFVFVGFYARPALSAGFTIDRSCTNSRYYGTHCRTVVAPIVDDVMTAEEIAAKAARIAKWEAYCTPKRNYDNEGVVRLTYAKKGCEFGRSED